MQLHSIVYLPGRCDEAAAFYQAALNAELLYVRRLRDHVPAADDKVLRAALRIGTATIYLSDGHENQPPGIQGFSLSLQLADTDAADRIVQALAEGGRVLVPPRRAVFADWFCALLDRFGVHWTLEVSAPREAHVDAVDRRLG